MIKRELIKILRSEANCKNSICLYQVDNGNIIACDKSAYVISRAFPDAKCYKLPISGDIVLCVCELSKTIIEKISISKRNLMKDFTEEGYVEWCKSLPIFEYIFNKFKKLDIQ